MNTVKDESNALAIYILLALGLLGLGTWTHQLHGERDELRGKVQQFERELQDKQRAVEQADAKVKLLKAENKKLVEQNNNDHADATVYRALNEQRPWMRDPIVTSQKTGATSDQYPKPKLRELVEKQPTTSYQAIPQASPSYLNQPGYKEYKYQPSVAENGDVRGRDNDGDGRSEPVHVRGYHRKDGTYVRGHYRAAPSRR